MAEEARLVNEAIPQDQWIYIAANADYPNDAEPGTRLGGFSCSRKWWLDQKITYPNNFYTIVDGFDVGSVLRYVADSSFYLPKEGVWVQGISAITNLIQTEIRTHLERRCSCY